MVRLTLKEKNEVMATVTKIITETIFKTHVYTFGGKNCRQSQGGPIGLRSWMMAEKYFIPSKQDGDGQMGA